MKKILYILFLISFTSFGQKLGAKVFEFDSITTSVRNTYDVPSGKRQLIWNGTEQRFEHAGQDDVWIPLGGGATYTATSPITLTGDAFGLSIPATVTALEALTGSNRLNVSAVEFAFPKYNSFIGSGSLDTQLQDGILFVNPVLVTGIPAGANSTSDRDIITVINYNNNEIVSQKYIDIGNNKEFLRTKIGAAAFGAWVETTAVAGAGTDDQTASEVPFTPNGSIAATNVQLAIQEVRDEAGGSPQTLSLSGVNNTTLEISDGNSVVVPTLSATDQTLTSNRNVTVSGASTVLSFGNGTLPWFNLFGNSTPPIFLNGLRVDNTPINNNDVITKGYADATYTGSSPNTSFTTINTSREVVDVDVSPNKIVKVTGTRTLTLGAGISTSNPFVIRAPFATDSVIMQPLSGYTFSGIYSNGNTFSGNTDGVVFKNYRETFFVKDATDFYVSGEVSLYVPPPPAPTELPSLVFNANPSTIAETVQGDPITTWTNAAGAFHATSSGASRPTVDIVGGQKQVRFSGSGQFMAIPHANTNFVPGTDEFTILVKVGAVGGHPTTQEVLFSKGQINLVTSGQYVLQTQSSVRRFRVGGAAEATNGTVINPNDTYVMVVRTANFDVWVNGTRVLQNQTLGTVTTTNDLILGATFAGANGNYDGSMSHFRIYEAALSDAEVASELLKVN